MELEWKEIFLIQEDGTSRILGDKFPRTADEIEEYMENKK